MRTKITLLGLLMALPTFAQVEPNVKPEIPVNGQQYLLVNQNQSSNQFMSRTSWDGAVYFLSKDDSHYADYALTAIQNEDGTWSFSLPGTKTVETGEYDEEGNAIKETVDVTYYMVLPNGSPNLNVNSETPAKWGLAPKEYNYFQLIAGEGNNPAIFSSCKTVTGDFRLHLNNGNQFFVLQYYGAPFYPDCWGGITETDDESTGDIIIAANDSATFNWGFVSVDNIVAFTADHVAVQGLNNFHKKYIADEAYSDYAEGFNASFDAAKAIYKDAEYNWEDDPVVIAEMLSKKEEFFKAIEEAELIEDPTPALTNAIENAKNTFKSATAAAVVQAGIDALKNAVTAFKEGTGDLTGLGTNMSFEDLSAQDGGETSSVAAPPYGWNMYINGTQVTTADEIRSNGITAWCGVNNDSEGEAKDGAESFGIWTSGVPQFELSQTIEGLENGTYLVTAGLMAGANGGGSRLTTQRIFGNLNSAYYADESMYDQSQLDNSEVYSFAGNVEVQTDREMFFTPVRAYVYDGTLTFGVRTDGNIAATFRTSGNGAGGDGWFKVDNFTIQKLGYNGEDAAAVANHFINALAEAQEGGDVFAKALEDEIGGLIDGEVDASTPADQINKTIITLKDKLPEVLASIAAYKKLNEAIENGWNDSDPYSYTPSYEEVLVPALEAAQEEFEERTDQENIDALIEAIKNAIAQCKSEAVQPGDYANVIANGSFEDRSAQGGNNSDGAANPPAGWTLVLNGMECKTNADYGKAGASMGWCAINSGDNLDPSTSIDENGVAWDHQYTEGDHLWGIWAGNVPDVELSQTIKGLPAGTYTLTCDMVVQWNWGGQCLTTQRIFANNYIQMFGAEDTYEFFTEDTEDMIRAKKCDEEFPEAEVKHMNYAGHYQSEREGLTNCPRPMSLTFGLQEGEDLKLGFRTNNVDVEQNTAHPYDSAGWFKLDNFQLLYVSADVPAGAEATSVKDIESSSSIVGRKYFNVSGAEVSQPVRGGVTIIKNMMSDGSVKTTKVLQK